MPDMRNVSQTMAALRAENRQLRSAFEQLKTERATVRAVSPAPVTAAPKPNATPATVLAVRQQRALFNNLRQIAAARDEFILENGRPPTSITELVGPQAYIRELRRWTARTTPACLPDWRDLFRDDRRRRDGCL